MKFFSAIVFDFDGTLVDSNTIKRELFYDVFDGKIARDKVDKVVDENPELDRTGIIRLLFEINKINKNNIRDAVEKYTRLAYQAVKNCPEIPGAEEGLKNISTIFPVYLSSATPEVTLKRIVEARGWAPYFKDIYGGPESKYTHIARIAEKENIPLSSIIYIGDQPADHRASLSSGCEFIPFGPLRTEFGLNQITFVDLAKAISQGAVEPLKGKVR